MEFVLPVRISKYKNIFGKFYIPKWSEEVFMIEKVKNIVPWTHVTEELNGEGIVETFYKIELQKTKLSRVRIQKVIKNKGRKLYVKWKGYDE